MFERLAILVGKRRTMRNKLVGAMIYPLLLTILSVKILAVMMFFVVPRFAGMFDTLGVELPATTRFMMTVATQLRSWGVLLAIGVLGGIVGAIGFFRSARGVQFAANLQTRMPVVGRLMSRLIQAKTFRILGMLLEARVGLLDALSLARGVTRNDHYQKLYDHLEEAVTKGDSVTRAMEENRLIDPAIVQAIRTGEHSGRLGESITYVADVLDEENTELLNAITKLVEPVILILMCAVVGTVAISLFMPLFDMTAAI
jgi:type IV pilus assembly protein PilC